MNTILLVAAIPSSFFVFIAFLELFFEGKITLSSVGHCLFTLSVAASFFCVTFVVATALSFSVR
jgi:hypothetical protein